MNSRTLSDVVMDLLNQKVIHKMLGTGVITAQNENSITVQFRSRVSRFMYPDPNTFHKFLTMADPAVHAAILQEEEDEKAAIEAARLKAEEEKRKAEEEARAAEEAQREALAASRKTPKAKTGTKPVAARTERTAGKPLTFFVFQGDTFDIESTGGFIWAPQHSQSGGRVFHWDNMLLVKKGDIVLHGCNGYVVAVSTAVSDCYDCVRPKEREFEESWNNEGRRVDLAYTKFVHPIKTSDFVYEILEHCKVKYSPFDKDGNGNMGYLYELNRDLARIFLRAALKINTYLDDVDYVSSLLSEDTE